MGASVAPTAADVMEEMKFLSVRCHKHAAVGSRCGRTASTRRRIGCNGGALSSQLVLLALVCLLTICVRADGGVPAVRESTFDGQIVDIRWLGPSGRILLLYTSVGALHRSTDAGKSWAEISGKDRKNDTWFETDSQPVRIARLTLSTADSNVLIAITKNGIYYISENAGLTWRPLKFGGGRISLWWFHSTHKEWALASSWSLACAWETNGANAAKDKPPKEEDGGLCTHSLYATKDSGKTFQQVSKHVIQFSWGVDAQRDRVYFTHHRNKRDHQKKLTRWMEDVDFAYTDNMGLSSQNIVPSGNKFVISSGFILVAVLKDAAKQNVVLKVSANGGQSFDTAVLPQQNLGQKSYVILDASEGTVVLHVDHGSGRGHLYTSDSSGVYYSLSLANNVRANGDCAFEKVMNLKGIYIANVKEQADAKAESTEVSSWAEEAEDHIGGLSAMTQSDRAIRYLSENGRRLKGEFRNDTAYRRLAAAAVASPVRTVISFSKGGRWSYLKPPQVDSLGNKIDCPVDTCALHLHGITDYDHFVPFYSYHNAVGIIMGTGNIGSSLSYKPEEANTYLSRDGGVTWTEEHKGVYIYEFGNYGGLLIMTDWIKATTQAIFSWDEGQSWIQVDVTKTPFKASNILTEPHAKTTQFIMFGSRAGKGLMYYIDFDAMGQRKCKGLASAGTEDSDYEKWTPSDGSGTERCLLGKQRIYTRRKQLASCFNSEGNEWPITERHCQCTQENFECEVGFRREIGSATCIPDSQEENDYLRIQIFDACNTGASFGFFHTEAYRRVAGDTCKGGWTPPKATIPCPHSVTTPPSKGWGSTLLIVAAIIVPIALVSLACAGFCASSAPTYSEVSGMRGHAGASAQSAMQAAARWGGSKFHEMREVSARGGF